MRLFLFYLLVCVTLFNHNLESTASKSVKNVLVIGCGRSGTAYISKFLKASGIDAPHEHRMGSDGCVSWLMTADVHWAPWGPLFRNYKFRHIFHQVRNPLKVIQSFYNVPPSASWEWICKVIPEIKMFEPNLVKCAKYWFYWNRLAASRAEWTYRIEDFDEVFCISPAERNPRSSQPSRQ